MFPAVATVPSSGMHLPPGYQRSSHPSSQLMLGKVLATSILVLYNTSCRHDAASSCRLDSSHAICTTSLAPLQLSSLLYAQSIAWAFTQDLSTALQRHIRRRIRTYCRNKCFGLAPTTLSTWSSCFHGRYPHARANSVPLSKYSSCSISLCMTSPNPTKLLPAQVCSPELPTRSESWIPTSSLCR